MDTLTRKQLIELAPGAAPRKNAAKERLIDTSAWLDNVAEAGFEPVMAMQGSTHEDAERDPKNGRHLVVAANSQGVAVTLLNSHDRLMRVWSGAGHWWEGELLLADVSPIQRWKFCDVKWVPGVMTDVLKDAMDRLFAKTATSATEDHMAEAIAKEGYLGGRGRPSWRDLQDASRSGAVFRRSVGQAAFAMVAAGRLGNLAPATKKQARRIKGIRRPDAYQHLALAAYRAAMEACK